MRTPTKLPTRQNYLSVTTLHLIASITILVGTIAVEKEVGAAAPRQRPQTARYSQQLPGCAAPDQHPTFRRGVRLTVYPIAESPLLYREGWKGQRNFDPGKMGLLAVDSEALRHMNRNRPSNPEVFLDDRKALLKMHKVVVDGWFYRGPVRCTYSDQFDTILAVKHIDLIATELVAIR